MAINGTGKEKIDLHMHSRVSDGTDTPAEILALVKSAGITCFALTDHDAVKGSAEIRGILKPGDPRFIPGIEFSCRDSGGKYHVLGYGMDPEGPTFVRVVEKGHNLRMSKLLARLDFLEREYGFSLTPEERDDLLSQDNPGKPHIAKLMISRGMANSIDDAIHRYINKQKLAMDYVTPQEAIEGILGAGGIPVLAHPPFGSGDELILGDDMDQRLRHLLDYGLRGLEGLYSGYSPRIRADMLEFAEKYDLYVTAGSDYHGKTKLVVLGDTGMDEIEEMPARLIRFLEECP